MKLGDKLLLHTEPFPHHKNGKQDIFIPVVIIEIKNDVPDLWTGENKHTGWKAKGLEDGREYTCNWVSFPSDSMTPCWQWDMDLKYGMIYDITYVRPPFKPSFVEKYQFVGYCKKHCTLYYKAGQKELFKKMKMSECFDCYMEHRFGKERKAYPKEVPSFKGWR